MADYRIEIGRGFDLDLSFGVNQMGVAWLALSDGPDAITVADCVDLETGREVRIALVPHPSMPDEEFATVLEGMAKAVREGRPPMPN